MDYTRYWLAQCNVQYDGEIENRLKHRETQIKVHMKN